MSHPVNFGQLIVITSSFCCYTTHNCKKMQKKTILQIQQNMAWGKVGRYVKKEFKNFESCGPFIHTIKEPYQCSKMLADNSLSGIN
jgi:hypothetical protein